MMYIHIHIYIYHIKYPSIPLNQEIFLPKCRPCWTCCAGSPVLRSEMSGELGVLINPGETPRSGAP